MSLADDLRSAIIWDPISLRRSESQSARRFHKAMHLRFQDADLVDRPPDDHPLELAALGLALEYNEQSEEAAEQYWRLAGSHIIEGRLVGLALAAWMGDGDVRALELAVDAAQNLPHDDVQLRLSSFCKLLAIALDIAELEAAERCLQHALSELQSNSRLRQALLEVGHFCLGRDQFIFELDLNVEVALGAEQYVEALAGEAARSALDRSFVDRIRSASRQWIRFGQGDLNQISAAELQATWMGAVWMVPKLRRQLAVQLLDGAAETSSDFESGFAYWFLGRGGQTAEVGADLERHFVSTSSHTILVKHMRQGKRFGYWKEYLHACVALWHELPREVVEQILSFTSPATPLDRLKDPVVALWNTLAATDPELWQAAFGRLKLNEQVELLPGISEGVARRLSPVIASHVYELCLLHRDQITDRRDDVDRLLTTLHLLDPEKRRLPHTLVAEFSDATVAWLGSEAGHLVSGDSLDERVKQIANRLSDLMQSGRQGVEAVFGTSPFLLLGALGSMLSSASPSVEALLLAVVSDNALPGGYRSSALGGLGRYAKRHGLSSDAALQLAAVRPKVHDSLLDRTPAELLRIRQLRVLFMVDDTSDCWEVASLARNSDLRVRMEALKALDELGGVEVSLYVTVALGALYDPSPPLVRIALEGVAGRMSAVEVLRPQLFQRVNQLYALGDAEDRASAVRAVRNLSRGGYDSSEFRDLIASARRDRSWLVRDAVEHDVV